MESRNPVFSREKEFKRGGYATFDTRTPSATELNDMYAAPSASSVDTNRMTLDDVVIRTGTLFAVLLTAAAATYFVWQPTNMLPVFGAAIVGFILAMVVSFMKTVRPPLMLAYAAVEGVFVGGISFFYANAFGPGIVPQAILGTLCAFGAMLALYKTGVVRNSPRFQKTLMIAGVGYLVFGIANLLLSSFVDSWQNVYSGGGLLPVLISGFGVVLASFFLVLDFDFVEQGIRNGIPAVYAWTAAFGLVVTLVWLYLEILRLLSIRRGENGSPPPHAYPLGSPGPVPATPTARRAEPFVTRFGPCRNRARRSNGRPGTPRRRSSNWPSSRSTVCWQASRQAWPRCLPAPPR